MELSLLVHEQSAVVRSFRDARERDRQGGRSLKSSLISVGISVVLITSSVLVFNLSQRAQGPDEYPDEAYDPWDPSGQSSQGGSRWDWAALADASGLVDVIFVLDTEAAVQDPRESLAFALSSVSDVESASYQEDILNEVRGGVKKCYSRAISGFSARVSVESAEALSSMDLPLQIYPDLPVHALISDNIYQVGADQIWLRTDSNGQSVTGKGVVVAVIDSGVDYTHPDLGGGFGPSFKVMGGYDFYNNDSDPMDDNGHGTHVAGLIAANGATFKGVAPDAKILAYKALGSNGYSSESTIIEAIDRALDPNGDGDTSDHADVISMSLGGGGETGDPMCVAVKNAFDAGAVVVVAAGNDGPAMGTVSSPGLAPEAITVGAVDSSGDLASFSSRGTGAPLRIKPDICAPGVSISSTVPRSGTRYSSSTGYYTMSGTSMATPHVSGAAALLLQLHPSWTPAMIKSALVTEAADMSESVWIAGSGQLWIPSSADTSLFISSPLVSSSHVVGFSHALTISNSGASSSFSLTARDWSSLAINGSSVVPTSIDASQLSQSSLTISSGGSGSVTLTVLMPQPAAPEGYFDGELVASDGARSVRVQFGYAILSVMNVHVIDMSGKEVFDDDGGVWAYRIPDVGISVSACQPREAAPPASFVLESGTYSVHSAGHQEIYFNDDPYALSTVVQLNRTQTQEVYLRMSSAHRMVLDLETDDGTPIYVDHYWLYFRYVGQKNVSFHLFSIDDTIYGSKMFNLPRSRTIYVSDTDARVGMAITGYAYSAAMYDFMSRNWRHWYEVANSASPDFVIEASADLKYFLSWEFDGVDPSTSNALTLESGKYSVFKTKYDLPGAVDPVGNIGNHLSMGTASDQYLRRDTGTSIPAIFSGLTRQIIVQGVFEEYYTPGYLRDTAFDQEFFTPNYQWLVNYSFDTNSIFLPDRNFLEPLPATVEYHRVGQGPFYPSVRTMNTNGTLAVVHPVLRDQSGAKVVGRGIAEPHMLVFRDNSLIATYDMSEFQRALDAIRYVSLPGSGAYRVELVFSPCSQVCDRTTTVLGFSSPAIDVNPPEITGMSLPVRFVPGDLLGLQIGAEDDSAVASVEASWRSTEGSAWKPVVVTGDGTGRYSAQIQTAAADNAVHLKVRASDPSGNYIEYSASNVSIRQIPVSFDLTINQTEFEYRNGDAYTVISGHLTDLDGNPISSTDAIPLDLWDGDRKLATILDEYVNTASHTHNGDIRFEWHFNPSVVFSGPDQAISVAVTFDLGIYESVSKSFLIRSIKSTNPPPTIVLEWPANGSVIVPGQSINLDITDNTKVTASAYLDGVFCENIYSPWQVTTASWSDGYHVLLIVAQDDQGGVSQASFQFGVDALSPSVQIVYPTQGSRVPAGSTIVADVHDTFLSEVTYKVDSGAPKTMSPPYSVDMTGWAAGSHAVTVAAKDLGGHSVTKTVSFEIADSTVVVRLDSPTNGSVVRSGVSLELSADGEGAMTYRWSEGGVWHDLGSAHTISTVGWSQGVHDLLINVTNDMGGWDQVSVVITIDDIAPVIVLVSPANNSFVSDSDVVTIEIRDANIGVTEWVLWGQSFESSSIQLSIALAARPNEGRFAISMTATDKAGNPTSCEFLFEMDSSAPSLSIGGLVSGEVAKAGSVLHVSASDAYLTEVEWSLDDGQLLELAAPHDIDTSSMSVGWHSLQVLAHDASGKQTVIAISFYLDDTQPVLGTLSVTSFKVGKNLDVQVTAVDDYAVGSVSLFYELHDGSFASIPMSSGDDAYVVALPADVLWDGMEVYVACVDVAGNSVLGPRVQLTAVASGTWLDLGAVDSVSWLVLICAAAIISTMSFMYVSKRRGKEGDRIAEDAPVRDLTAATVVREEPPPMPSPPPKASVPSRSRILMRATQIDHGFAEPRPARDPLEELEDILGEQPKLIDSIPEIVIKDDSQRKGEPPVADFGDLIERELIMPGLKNSVYKEDLNDSNIDIEAQLEELRAMAKDWPKRPLE